MASRRPVTTNGTVAGKTTDVNSRRWEAPKLWATSSKRRSTVRTPWVVGITTEKNAPRKTTVIFDSTPIPTHSAISGRRATRGRELNRLSHGSAMYDRRRYQPKARPIGTARTTAEM